MDTAKLNHNNNNIQAITLEPCNCLVATAALMPLMSFLKKLKKLAEDDPRRVIHSIKVGLGLSLVSVFYYVSPLFKSTFKDCTMWAVITVVLVMEFTVGGALTKGLNRALATFLASVMGVGAHHLAVIFGEKGEPFILGSLVFIIAVAATFLRFVPELRTRYDYGVLIFILTFCLVAVSSYRQENLLLLACRRSLTIVTGVLVALVTSILLFPVWAGEDLHKMTAYNLQKLAAFLEEKDENGNSGRTRPSEAYKSINNARWEPVHGKFRFKHPWKEYTKIGALSRQCAYTMHVLHAHINKAESQTPFGLELCRRIRSPCMNLSLALSDTLKELASSILSMTTQSSATEHMAKACTAADQLKTSLLNDCELSTVLHAATIISLLVEITECIRQIRVSVEELAALAQFKSPEAVTNVATVRPIVDIEVPHVSVVVEQ
ncbi:Aluminum-activated malate transporter 1, partial [Ananas comosus]